MKTLAISIIYYLKIIRSRLLNEPTIKFTCNICGSKNHVPLHWIGREKKSCRCGSSVRTRSLVHLLSINLYNKSVPIAKFPHSPHVNGIDLSGSYIYTKFLEQKLSFKNTYYHKEPYLDITNPATGYYDSCDFILSSEVLEHVDPPVELAFVGLYKILRPGGHLILTIPYTLEEYTIEHFPNLYNYSIKKLNGIKNLHNITKEGETELFDELVFHGGEGETLELRILCKKDIINFLEMAGFIDIQIHGDNNLEYGVIWDHNWSLPITARKPNRQ